MNWSPGSASAEGDAQVAPRSKDWLAITSEFVLAVYGSLGAGVTLSRMSDQTTARWAGLALGAGGLAGAYAGARIQSRLPEPLIRRLMAILVLAIGARYLWVGVG